MNEQANHSRRSGVYLNAVLTAIALLLAALLVRGTADAPVISEAVAGDTGGRGLINPADQRREIINQLKRVNDRLEKMAGEIKGPIEVEVVRMPPSASNGD